MRPLEVPISFATSRTVVEARPLRRATASAASTIASRRSWGDIRAIARSLAHIAQLSNKRLPCPSGGERQGASQSNDPDDALPRANERPQRDRAVGALVEPPRGRALPDVGEVRVLR